MQYTWGGKPVAGSLTAPKKKKQSTPAYNVTYGWGGKKLKVQTPFITYRPGQTASSSPSAATPQPPVPIDPEVEAERIAASRGLGVAQLNYGYGQGALAQDTGYNATGRRDYSNPYSRASLLEESYKRSKRDTTGSYAGQGQLYSGALRVAQGENARNYSIGSDQLQRGAAGGYQGLRTDLLNTASSYGTALPADKWNEILRAMGVS